MEHQKMNTGSMLAILLVTFLLCSISFGSRFRPKCALCEKDSECFTKKCWRQKCIQDDKDYREDCFKPECAKCLKSSQCSTDKCWGQKCVYDSAFSMNKCFVSECAPCKQDNECVTQVCRNYKCVDPSKPITACSPSLKPECSSCENSSECITENCKWGKCVQKHPSSSRHCFLRPECAACKHSRQCQTNKCWGGKCVYKTVFSFKLCGFEPTPDMFPFLKKTPMPHPSPSLTTPPTSSTPSGLKYDCASCSEGAQCHSGMCSYGKCGGPHRVNYCSKSECTFCRRNQECESRKCWDAICTDGSYESLLRCGRKPECSFCVDDLACATMKCSRRRCVFNSAVEDKRCF